VNISNKALANLEWEIPLYLIYCILIEIIESALKQREEKILKKMRRLLAQLPQGTTVPGFENEQPSGKTWIDWFLNHYKSLKQTK